MRFEGQQGCWETVEQSTDPIGQGGNSYVYLVNNNVTTKRHALKVFKHEATEGERLNRFLDEIDIVRKLNGIKRCVQYIDHGFSGGKPFYVMPYFKNGTYRDRYLRGASFSLVDTLHDFIEIIEGVSDVHLLNLAIRDIKPQNILISDEHTPILSDFGLSMWTDTLDENRNTPPAGVVGSQGYRPPEWESRYPPPNHKPGDIWSLGRTLWAMITGRNPPNTYESLGGGDSHVRLYIDKNYANMVQSIITSCTRQDPLSRPSIHELANNVRDVLEKLSGTTPSRSNLEDVVKRFNLQVMNSNAYLDASRLQSELNIQKEEMLGCRQTLVTSLTEYVEKLTIGLPKDLGTFRVISILNGTTFLNQKAVTIPLPANDSWGKIISLRFDPSDQMQLHNGLQYGEISFYIGIGMDNNFYWIVQQHDQTDKTFMLIEQITTKSLATLVDKKLGQLDGLVKDRLLPMIERHFTK